jgi:hypothetical protein
MPITYNSLDIRGVAAEPIIEEILFENKTIADDLVTLRQILKRDSFTETLSNSSFTSIHKWSTYKRRLFNCF